jgi:hypothetical protein
MEIENLKFYKCLTELIDKVKYHYETSVTTSVMYPSIIHIMLRQNDLELLLTTHGICIGLIDIH